MQCLNGTAPIAAIVQMEQAYGFYNMTQAQIESKVESFLVFHFAEAVTQIGKISTDYNAGNYDQTGKDMGALVQMVFGGSEEIAFF